MPGMLARDRDDKPWPYDAKYLRIFEETQKQLDDSCSELEIDPECLRTLLLVAEEPDEQTWAMIDGVLVWAGVSDIEQGRDNYCKKVNGFVVPSPGVEGVAPLLINRGNFRASIYSALHDVNRDPAYRANAAWEPLQLMITQEQLGKRMIWLNMSSPSEVSVKEEEAEDEGFGELVDGNEEEEYDGFEEFSDEDLKDDSGDE
jgi:hypothetical protein